MNDNLSKALSIFIEAMRPFVVGFLLEKFKDEPWEGIFFARLKPDKQNTWNKAVQSLSADSDRKQLVDYSNLSSFAIAFKQELTDELGNSKEANKLISYLQEIQEVRNKCNHYQPLDEDEIDRAFGTMKLVAKLLQMPDLVTEIDTIKNRENEPTIQIETPVTTEASSTVSFSEDSPLPAWYTNVYPHYDIRNGSLDESVFAANLSEVAMGIGQEVYSNPTMFFEKTYITAGLRDIANRVVRALNGEETDNRVISLQTGFGGGKTHTLISLYHITKTGKSLLSSAYTQHILDSKVAPQFENAQVAVFTNNTTDVSQGRTTDDGITIYTLWGELAYQLGGLEGYNLIKKNDIERISPAANLFRPILEKSAPALILIDELADYCNKASAVMIGKGSLSDQTIGFMQTLTEVVYSVPRCVLIATLPASATEVASSAIGQQILTALENRIVRVGTSIKPVEDEEIFEVVRRRLFDNIGNPQVIELVLNRYKNTYHNRRSDLPNQADRMEYINKMRKSYPFHPELIDMFRLKWGQDSRFQRTRGVLRLLASIVKDLWTRRGSLTGTQALIHTSDVNLSNLPTLTGTITSLMGSQWETVIHADVIGTSSNAYKIDNEDPNNNIGKYNLTQGIATTILMASLGNLQNKGLTIEELKLCILKPSAFNHSEVNSALNKLEQVAHYLYSTNVGSRSYWFQSKPNINILVNQAKAEISQADISGEIINRLNAQTRNVSKIKVLVNPANDIPEQKSLTLVILGPEYATQPGSINTKTKKQVEQIAQNKGYSSRIYRNTILYLACSEIGLGMLHSKLLEYLACAKIQAEYSGQIEPEQKKDILERKAEYDKQANALLIAAYNIVCKYSVSEGIEKIEIKDFAQDFNTQLSSNLFNNIKEEEWLLEKSIGLGTLRSSGLYPTIEQPIQVNDLYEAFLRFDDKPMICGVETVSKSIQRYCENGDFNVACGEQGNYNHIYHHESVPFLDVTDPQYWLVDKSINNQPKSEESSTDEQSSAWNSPTGEKSEHTAPSQPVDELRKFKSIKVSGKVPVERWTDLFSSFVVPLKNNGLEIEISFKAKTTSLNPLDESAQIYKVVKESAMQLGLNLEEE